MAAVDYIRVSSEDQLRGLSLEVQHEANQVDAARAGTEIIKTYADEGKSANTDRIDKRPALQQLLQDAERRLFDTVIVYKYDRFARKMLLALDCRAKLERLGIQVRSATEPFDTTTAAGRFSERNMLNVAELFSDMLSERMTAARRAETARGRWVGAPPFGYDRVEGRLVPNADAPTVQLIFQLYATRSMAILDIVDELAARGLRSRSTSHFKGQPYPFTMASVRAILHNRVYLGETRCGEIRVPDAHLALIDAETWARAAAILDERATRRGRTTVRSETAGILTGIVRCAVCGGPCWHNQSGNGWRSYVCHARARRRGCENPRAHVDEVDALVRDVLAHLTLPEDWKARTLATLAAPVPPPPDPGRAAVEAELRTIKQAFLEEQIDAAIYEARRAALRARLRPPQPAQAVDLDRAAALLQDMAQVVDRATPDDLRALASEVFSAVWLNGRRVEALTPRRAYLPLVRLIRENVGGRSFPHAFPTLWADFRQVA